MKEESVKALFIDGPYLAHRSYGAPYQLTTSTGLSATMIHSFIRTLYSVHKHFQPDRTVIAWESHGTKSWRRDLYPEYKNVPKDVSLTYISQLADVQLLLYFLNIKQYFAPNYEADDVIATLVKPGTIIYSVDKDLMQLINGKDIMLYDGERCFDELAVFGKFGVLPKHIPDLLAIWGDTADNIDGIPRYGLKKSLVLLRKYGTVEDIPETELIYKYREKYLLNKKLATLNRACKLESIPNENFKTKEDLNSLLDKYQLNSIKKDIEKYKSMGEKNE